MNLLGVVESNLGLKDAGRPSKALSTWIRRMTKRYGLGLTYEDDDPPRALELLQKAIEIDGRASAAHRELGYVLWRLDRDREAEISLSRALDLDERDSWTYNHLGRVLRRQGRLQEAEAALTRATELSPDEPFFLSNLADLYVVLGKDALRAHRSPRRSRWI